MLSRILSIIAVIFICIVLILVGFFNYDKFAKLINDDNWIDAEVVNEIKINNVLNLGGTSELSVLTKDSFNIYNSNFIAKSATQITATECLSCTNGVYQAFYIKDTKDLYIYKNSEVVFNQTLTYDIDNLFINKNGYLSIIFSNLGSKSGIKVYSNKGEELFTNTLAASYATKSLVSNDNKFLYVAEVDISGVMLQSSIRAIDIEQVVMHGNSSNAVSTYLIGNDEIILDISCDKTLLVRTDKAIYKQNLLSNSFECMKSFDNNTVLSSIQNGKYPVIIESNIDEKNISMNILGKNENVIVSLEEIPQSIYTFGELVILNYGDKIELYNSNGNKIKRYLYTNQLLMLHAFKNEDRLALCFRDKIEII